MLFVQSGRCSIGSSAPALQCSINRGGENSGEEAQSDCTEINSFPPLPISPQNSAGGRRENSISVASPIVIGQKHAVLWLIGDLLRRDLLVPSSPPDILRWNRSLAAEMSMQCSETPAGFSFQLSSDAARPSYFFGLVPVFIISAFVLLMVAASRSSWTRAVQSMMPSQPQRFWSCFFQKRTGKYFSF